ncbi:hypothetical protein RJ640_011809 [Escallonia rubra]|uniref:Uncharacterized protein n=1 Tax=Escallonia rubra TaxID=112253 RepID=A0AA88UI32_9ASTE|nr:hypothetical protein RJ640_011809 [Escallonia rubra]
MAVIGTACALNILFHIPIWAGVIFTGFSTLLLLGVQRYGLRKLEILIAVLVFAMAGSFFGELSYVKPPAVEVLKGMFIPKLSGTGATGAAIAVLGALIMPHNLFLHSALVLSRRIPPSVRCMPILFDRDWICTPRGILNQCFNYLRIGNSLLCKKSPADNIARCNDLTLDSASFLLKNVLGKSGSTIYAIALLASGQSSTITGTFAGQFIMQHCSLSEKLIVVLDQGFLDLKMRKWVRNLMTRSIAIIPSLLFSIIGGPSSAGRLIILASIVLSFELPFALIPLLKFSSSAAKMGPHTNSIYVIVLSWILMLGMSGINIYYLSTGFVHWLVHNNLPKAGKVLIGILVFPLMAIYILTLLYLMFRKDTVVTFVEPLKLEPVGQMHMEGGHGNADGVSEQNHVPFGEDLSDTPFPK